MMDKKLKISVIIPVYNEVRYLEECVSSICNQTYRNLEIILIDDGSADQCYEMCDSYRKKDERIKVIHKENGGSWSARKRGIEMATGDYVAFVDSDDWIESDLYRKMAEAIEGKEPDMIAASNYYRNYADGHSLNAYNNNRVGFWRRDEFEGKVFPYFIKTDVFFDTEFPIAMTYYLFKRDIACSNIRKISSEIKTSEDYVFLVITLLNAKSFAAISYRGYHYRSNIDSKTYTLKNMKELLQPVYKTVDNAISKSSYNAYTQSLLKKKNILHIYHALMLKDYGKLIKVTDDFLFPYSKVKKGSSILIYGAGKLGKQIYNALNDINDYKVIGLADKNWKMYIEQGFNVIAPEDIFSLDYNYIIIAISYANIKKQVINDLMGMGVDAGKIAEIDLDVLDEEHLPFGNR